MTCNAPDSIGTACNIGTVASSFVTVQAIEDISLDNATFPDGDPAGTVVGAISVSMWPASPAFSGTLSLTGADASLFQLSSTTLPSNLELASTGTIGTFNINIVATQTDAIIRSPLSMPFTIVGAVFDRITEAGDTRITEAGGTRVTE